MRHRLIVSLSRERDRETQKESDREREKEKITTVKNEGEGRETDTSYSDLEGEVLEQPPTHGTHMRIVPYRGFVIEGARF